jgi:hypothetical protein
MKTFLIIVLIGLMVMVVVSLVRGIIAFLQTSKADLARPESEGPSPSQLAQNRAMMQRILFQGAAIVVVALLLAAAG